MTKSEYKEKRLQIAKEILIARIMNVTPDGDQMEGHIAHAMAAADWLLSLNEANEPPRKILFDSE